MTRAAKLSRFEPANNVSVREERARGPQGFETHLAGSKRAALSVKKLISNWRQKKIGLSTDNFQMGRALTWEVFCNCVVFKV